MTKLDDRLQQIRKIEVTDVDVVKGKRAIRDRLYATPQSWLPQIVTACMFVVLCFLIFVPNQHREPSQSTKIESQQIENFIVLSNWRPNIDLNVNSPFYLGRHVVTDNGYVKLLEQLLPQVMVNGIPWDGKTDVPTIHEMAVNFKNGTTLHLKSDYGVLYDVTNNVQYDITDSEIDSQLALLLNKIYVDDVIDNDETSMLPYVIVIIFVLYLIFERWYRKRYSELDLNGKTKRLPRWISFTLNFLLIFLIGMSRDIFGAGHVGYLIIIMSLYAIIISQLEIRLGVMRPNNVHLKFLLPIYLLIFIVTIVLILVV